MDQQNTHCMLLRNFTVYFEIIAITDRSDAPIFFKLPHCIAILCSLGLLFTWTFGLLGKYAVFISIFRVGLSKTPINLLILTDQTINLIHRSLTIWATALVLHTNQPLVSFFGKSFCDVTRCIAILGTCHAVYGSFGITCYRAIVVRKAFDLKVVSVRHLWPLATISLAWSLAMTFVTSVIFYHVQHKSFVADLCYGYSESYSSILKDYNTNGRILHSKV